MIKVETIYELAGKLYDEFTTTKRGDDVIVVLKNRETELGSMASDLVYEVHDGLLPSDILYDQVHTILEAIHDTESDEPTELELQPDVYTSDLMEWMGDSLDNKARVEEAIREYGLDDSMGLDGAIQMAQVHQMEEVAQEVIDFLNDRLEEIEDEEESE